MSLIFSVPGKTFLAGEYLALDGGLTLLAMTEPRFQLRVTEGPGAHAGIPAGSPAANFTQRHPLFFKNLHLEFTDPHNGAGGWGASTAQYLCVFALWSGKQASNLEAEPELDVKELLAQYRLDAWNGEGRAPSGADMVGQLKGGLTFFERNTGRIIQQAWPFEHHEGYLLKTDVKVPTHEHLRTLSETDFSSLAPFMEQIKEAWLSRDAVAFGEGITAYGKQLARDQRTAMTTLSILHDLLWLQGVAGAKGCGALGADLVFIFIERDFVRAFEFWASENDFQIVKIRERLGSGLELKVESTIALSDERDLSGGAF